MKIISGGQTGADQAGLYAARDCGLETGGYAPANYMTKDGPNYKLRDDFGLISVLIGGYKKRTWMNVESSDCTLRFAYNFNSPGEKCTFNAIKYYEKPYDDYNLKYKISDFMINGIVEWILRNNFQVINIAGNTQTERLDTYTPTHEILCRLFRRLKKYD